jgi:hypothetical protein
LSRLQLLLQNLLRHRGRIMTERPWRNTRL